MDLVIAINVEILLILVIRSFFNFIFLSKCMLMIRISKIRIDILFLECKIALLKKKIDKILNIYRNDLRAVCLLYKTVKIDHISNIKEILKNLFW